jgi:NAD(P)-dependent dehydrogenase (short-subunit alcohol dehydrogenase family)
MRTLAVELAPDMVRGNTIHPSAVNNDMIHNQALYHQLLPAHDGDITGVTLPIDAGALVR